jgi:acyl-coenzyme A thioesterase PaaI-like protein
MHVTDLAINQALGIRLAGPGGSAILELPESAILLNHVGTIHASAQYALAEAASGELLLRTLGEAGDEVFAVLRSSEVKYRNPAKGELLASARIEEREGSTLVGEISRRGRTMASIHVEVSDASGVVTMSGQFDWFLQRRDR